MSAINGNDEARIGLHEGSICLPAGFEDRTANLFVPNDPQRQPNLSIARDRLSDGETLSTYIDRQLQLLAARLPGHVLVQRRAEQLGQGSAALAGESIEAHYKNGRQTIRQRQAAFLIAPQRALILTAACALPFDDGFEALWRSWLDSFVGTPSAVDAQAAAV